MNFLLLIFLTISAWANPFDPFLVTAKGTGHVFHPQQPPYAYPFEVSQSLEAKSLDLKKLSSTYPEATLTKVAALYGELPFNDQLAVYNYPFPVRPEWEMLPHPYVAGLENTKPEQWISKFRSRLPEDQGVGSLAFQEKLDQVTGSRAFAGNKLTLLKTPRAYQEIIKRITEAKDHVFLSTFLFQCDPGTAPLVELLEKKVKAGVPVYLIFDRLMSQADPVCRKKLKSIGVQVGLQGSLTHIFHEKMLITDANFAMVDGQNLLGPQVSSNGVNNLINDNAVGVEGPMVALIAQRFIQHWEMKKSRRFPAELKARYENLLASAQKSGSKKELARGVKSGSGVCRLVTKGPTKKHREILELYLETVKATRNYLFFNYIELTYKNPEGKLPGEVFLTTLVDHANANPDLRVDMLTNNWKRPTDIVLEGSAYDTRNWFSRVVTFVGESVFGQQYRHISVTRARLRERLKNDNFHWWSYAQYMHAKTLMSDNIWTLIGSYNINMSSQNGSYEQTLACLDQKLAEEMQSSIVTDALNSLPIPLRN